MRRSLFLLQSQNKNNRHTLSAASMVWSKCRRIPCCVWLCVTMYNRLAIDFYDHRDKNNASAFSTRAEMEKIRFYIVSNAFYDQFLENIRRSIACCWIIPIFVSESIRSKVIFVYFENVLFATTYSDQFRLSRFCLSWPLNCQQVFERIRLIVQCVRENWIQ